MGLLLEIWHVKCTRAQVSATSSASVPLLTLRASEALENDTIYRTGAIWASKWSLACPGPAGVSGRALWACFGAARALEMSVRDPPKQCYLPHWSHLALEMAGRACLGAAGVSGRVVWACFGVARALKMAAQSRQCARKGCFRVLTNCCLPACPVGLPGCHLHLPACHSGTLSPASHEVLIF